MIPTGRLDTDRAMPGRVSRVFMCKFHMAFCIFQSSPATATL